MILPLACLITLSDQITKYWVYTHFQLGEGYPIIPQFFTIRKVLNWGAAWGIFSGQQPMLIAISIGMLGLLWHARHEILASSRLSRFSIGLLSGGILGNLIDRIKYGYVIDFLDFHYGVHYTFPAFNIADSAICVGIALYFIVSLLESKRKHASC